MHALCNYAYPGNVRELLNLMQRLAATGTARIDVMHLPRALRVRDGDRHANGADDAPLDERQEVEAALAKTEGNISRAATLLGLTRHGLKKRMLRLGLRAKGIESS
jgi:DNA-binding NtrC family response regulator